MGTLVGAPHKDHGSKELGHRMKVRDLATAIAGASLLRGDPEAEISTVVIDSRGAGPGALFCCVKGTLDDGHLHAASAVTAGATAILTEHDVDIDALDVAEIRVRPGEGRLAAALASSIIAGRPADHLTVVGVTGTNGKTTVVHLLGEVLSGLGYAAVTIGTLTGLRTTPSAPELHRQFADALDLAQSVGRRGAVAMEVSSHALDQQRVAGIVFDVAIFTNLSHDHLDYHGSMEAYFEAKQRLFDDNSASLAVVWVEGVEGRRLATSRKGATVEVDWSSVRDLTIDRFGSHFIWRGYSVSIGLIGRANVIDAVLAAEATLSLGHEVASIVEALEGTGPVPGRMEIVPSAKNDPLVIVDYAHTPDALEGTLREARGLVGQHGRVVVVFGCGGDRDAEKRPIMGQIASTLADVVVITTDNPRSERPAAIVEQILSGVAASGDVRIEEDRQSALAAGISAAGPDDVVVIAGKGHETTQIIGERTVDFDDRSVAALILAGERPC